MARRRKLKKWNGLLVFHRDQEGKSFREKEGYHRAPQLTASIAAYSQKDAIALLDEYGFPTSLYEFTGWWNPGWGNSMKGIEPDERAMWVEFERHGGNPIKVAPGDKCFG